MHIPRGRVGENYKQIFNAAPPSPPSVPLPSGRVGVEGRGIAPAVRPICAHALRVLGKAAVWRGRGAGNGGGVAQTAWGDLGRARDELDEEGALLVTHLLDGAPEVLDDGRARGQVAVLRVALPVLDVDRVHTWDTPWERHTRGKSISAGSSDVPIGGLARVKEAA